MTLTEKSLVPYVPTQHYNTQIYPISCQPEEHSPSKRVKLNDEELSKKLKDASVKHEVEPTDQSADCPSLSRAPPRESKRNDGSAKGCKLRRDFKHFSKELARSDLSARVAASTVRRTANKFDSTTFCF